MDLGDYMPLIKGGPINTEPQNQNIQQQPQQNNTDRVLRGLAQVAQGGAEGVAGLAGLPGSLDQWISGKTILPTSQSLTGHVQSAAQKILPESYLKPQGYEEKFLRNVGSSLPGAALALATGGAALPVAAATAGGALGETVAQEAGLGPIGEIAGSFLGSAGFSKGLHKLQTKYGIKPENLVTTATTAQKNLYDTEKKLGASINAPAKSYEHKLLKLGDKIKNSSALTTAQKTELIDKVQLSLGDIKGSNINASVLVDRKQGNNAFYRHLFGKKNEKPREFLDQLQKIIFEEGDTIGKSHPEWRTSWRDADDITKVLKYGEGLKEIAEEFPKISKIISHPLTKLVTSTIGLGAGYYTGISPLKIGIGASVLGAGYAGHKAKYLYSFLEKPATQKVLGDAFKYTSQRQIPQLTKALHKLNVDAKKYAENHPEVKQEMKSLEETKPKGRGLIKGGRI